MKEMPVKDISLNTTFQSYQKKFKALADERRLQIMYEITQAGEVCVCDLSETMDLPQSKLSYHLRILLDAQMILKETRGTWSYYTLNDEQVNHILSEELCCLFRSD
ncbi:winged helix-turn-helix transcriptional regulator [Halobacillus locisalis]|uniref:Winged helix-turn-helix transcriptional regulator n=1 Tax=Halobacillus locisalis TaxID=220753 RepID=A0A838CXC1_9BACI|nr:metalloregulator ArsR/SmtB family transcription factor [Halobacillus locisalis]MBA2176578.1 winged helix-turn-helix transcriptional regulator [Halobacillus locisalis]